MERLESDSPSAPPRSSLSSPRHYRTNAAEGRIACDLPCLEWKRDDSELFVLLRMTCWTSDEFSVLSNNAGVSTGSTRKSNERTGVLDESFLEESEGGGGGGIAEEFAPVLLLKFTAAPREPKPPLLLAVITALLKFAFCSSNLRRPASAPATASRRTRAISLQCCSSWRRYLCVTARSRDKVRSCFCLRPISLRAEIQFLPLHCFTFVENIDAEEDISLISEWRNR